jgi:hypothetical protein
MTLGYNVLLSQLTRGYLQQNFTTALGIRPLDAGTASFDLVPHLVNGQRVVILRAADLLEAQPGNEREMPIFGYWVPQGDSCVIPVRAGGLRQLVFTPDFSGCSIMVDQIDADNYRVYHVQGGALHFQREYLNHPARLNVLGLAAAMTTDDYSDPQQPRGFAFLKYEEDRWWIYVQKQTGIGLGWVQGQLMAIGGAQLPRGGIRMPVADLMHDIPRVYGSQNGFALRSVRNFRVQRRLMPNDDIW